MSVNNESRFSGMYAAGDFDFFVFRVIANSVGAGAYLRQIAAYRALPPSE